MSKTVNAIINFRLCVHNSGTGNSQNLVEDTSQMAGVSFFCLCILCLLLLLLFSIKTKGKS